MNEAKRIDGGRTNREEDEKDLHIPWKDEAYCGQQLTSSDMIDGTYCIMLSLPGNAF
jgi:hypothetical protein